jgi:hypothetical protein
MNEKIRLTVAIKVQRPHHHATLDRFFEDTGRDWLAISHNQSWPTERD